MKWGYLRESKADAVKAGSDKATGLCRTGLEVYLKAIFPEVDDWVHDKALGNINGKHYRFRPDYRSERLRLIVEFDGLPHYTNPLNIRKDQEKSQLYESLGYKVVRIPYFIQLSKSVVKVLFNRDVDEMFDERFPSLGSKDNNTPAFLCLAGIVRMAKEFHRFPKQYEVNIAALKKEDDIFLTGVDLLEKEYNNFSK